MNGGLLICLGLLFLWLLWLSYVVWEISKDLQAETKCRRLQGDFLLQASEFQLAIEEYTALGGILDDSSLASYYYSQVTLKDFHNCYLTPLKLQLAEESLKSIERKKRNKGKKR